MARTRGPPASETKTPLRFAIYPPIEPMLAKLADGLPEGEGWLFEPKWDGFRAIVFKDRDRFYSQSRDLRPLDRYFPEVGQAFVAHLPERCVVDGELVIVGPGGLDFDLLQLRLHPAASRVAKLSATTPAPRPPPLPPRPRAPPPARGRVPAAWGARGSTA